MAKIPESGDVKASSEFVEDVNGQTTYIGNYNRNVNARYILTSSLPGRFWLISFIAESAILWPESPKTFCLIVWRGFAKQTT